MQGKCDLRSGLCPFHRSPDERQVEDLIGERRHDFSSEADLRDVANDLFAADQFGSFVPLAHGGFPTTRS